MNQNERWKRCGTRVDEVFCSEECRQWHYDKAPMAERTLPVKEIKARVDEAQATNLLLLQTVLAVVTPDLSI